LYSSAKGHPKTVAKRGWNHFQRSTDKHVPFLISWWPFDPPPCTPKQHCESTFHANFARPLHTTSTVHSLRRRDHAPRISVPSDSYAGHHRMTVRATTTGTTRDRLCISPRYQRAHRTEVPRYTSSPLHHHHHRWQAQQGHSQREPPMFVRLGFDMSNSAMCKRNVQITKVEYDQDMSLKEVFEKFQKKYYSKCGKLGRICSFRQVSAIVVARVRQP
jgi:hypothetical protein